jgi:bifunctional DNA-binding transcriptional regulator/antitoxin component of YhaV-PrlF toxin-antitoxin module
MKASVSHQGQIVFPTELCRQDGIEVGQEFEIERIDRGEYRFVRTKSRPNKRLVDWLLACPEKGFFVPIQSESSDLLGPSCPHSATTSGRKSERKSTSRRERRQRSTSGLSPDDRRRTESN